MSAPTLAEVRHEYAVLKSGTMQLFLAAALFAASLAAPYAVNNSFSIEELSGGAVPEGTDTIFAFGVPGVAGAFLAYAIVKQGLQLKKFNAVADANNATYPFRLGSIL